jgi:hypothetical protein
MPIVATAASAVAAYVAKRGPTFFEEKVLPKLEELVHGAGDAAGDVPGRAKQAVQSAGDLADGLASRAANVVSDANGRRRDGLSSDELDRHLKERAEARAARRNSTRKAH